MALGVFYLGEHFQIFKPIILLVTIDVVDVFAL